ncbi:hypothetical protein [Bradyrhizobium sp. I1.7.5]|uniref:hypothetical protein n=1 Tax=Bradyrhizobium sp. I1.7.5 TaxID=3156363 RepID=UPI00339319EF
MSDKTTDRDIAPNPVEEHRDLVADALVALAGSVRRINVDPSLPQRDVIDLILDGELLTLDQAADVAMCSDEKIRRACELAAATVTPLGVKWATRWLVGRVRLLDDIERGKLDGRRGKEARDRAEDRARKYEGWARPQPPLSLPDRSTAG